MSSNENNLNGENEIPDDDQDFDDGLDNPLELDKMDVADVSGKTEESFAETVTIEKAIPQKKQEILAPAKSKKDKPVIWPVSLALVAVIILFSIIIWKITGSTPKGTTITPYDLYTTIGPISTTAGTVGTITLIITLKCNTLEIKEQIDHNNVLIKSRLLGFLSTAEAEKIIGRRSFEELKVQLKSEVNKTLNGNFIDSIYYSKLLMKY